MKKLRLIAVKSQREDILRDLMLLGCVEVSEPAETPEDGVLHRKGSGESDLQQTRARQGELLQALRELDRYAPEKKGLLTPLPEVSLQKLLEEIAGLKGVIRGEILAG